MKQHIKPCNCKTCVDFRSAQREQIQKEPHNTENGWCCACGYDIIKLSELIQIARDDFEKRLEEYRNSPDIWKNVGISKWRNWGEKNGYFDFFKGKLVKEIEGLKKDRALEFDEQYGFNQAISEVINLINSSK